MSRYIEAKELLTELHKWFPNDHFYDDKWDSNRVLKAIGETPDADVVAVVRCKDCKHYIKDKTFGDLWCNQGRQSNCVSGDDYCSRGERREDATEENDKG